MAMRSRTSGSAFLYLGSGAARPKGLVFLLAVGLCEACSAGNPDPKLDAVFAVGPDCVGISRGCWRRWL